MHQARAAHVLVSRQTLFLALCAFVAAGAGAWFTEHWHATHKEEFYRAKSFGGRMTGMRLRSERDGYEEVFTTLRDSLQAWKDAHGGGDPTTTAAATSSGAAAAPGRGGAIAPNASLAEQAQVLLQGLEDMQSVVEEKEFQLWEREGLLEYQEERLLNSEELELEMAGYINRMAALYREQGMPLPGGLEDKPYLGGPGSS